MFGTHIQRAVLKLPLPDKLMYYVNHEAGPFTVHFWAPSWKWMLSASNIADYKRPISQVSGYQQTALMATGLIWTRYGFVIKPVNYNLAAVNVLLAASGSYQVFRKLKAKQIAKTT